MLLVFQLNDFLAFITDFGESKPDLHSTVIYILRKSRTQGLVNIFSNFSNYGCLVAHSRLKPRGQRRSISFMISSARSQGCWSNGYALYHRNCLVIAPFQME